MREFENDELDWVSWLCAIAAVMLVIGFFALMVWCANAEKKARRELMPASYAKKWNIDNKS